MTTAIFLGAGASASEGAPVQNKLFQDYFKLCRARGNFGSSDMEKQLASFFLSMFDIDVKNGNLDKIVFPTFEEALGILDLADARNESFKDFSNVNIASNSGRLKFLRLYLTLLMAKTIHEKLQNSKRIHRTLVDNLLKLDLLENVFFLSTNYDILIDNALTNLYSRGISLDYGVDFANFNEPDAWTMPTENSIKLFKIHGSLNWLYCPTCNNLRLTPKEKGVIKLLKEDSYSSKTAVCKKCKTIYSPIIVPPTFYKDFSNVFLNLVWNKSEQGLLNAKHLIFCGYSFPDADMHIKYLIKRVQKNRQGTPLKVTIVNSHIGKKKIIKDEEKDRYERFLGQSVNYTKYSFEKFAKNPGLLIE